MWYFPWNGLILEKNTYFWERPKIVCLKFAKSGQLIHIYFNRVCFLGKMAELENGFKTVRINFYEKKKVVWNVVRRFYYKFIVIQSLLNFTSGHVSDHLKDAL